VQYITSCPVAPFNHGEAGLQHYNTVMAMAHLQECTDAIAVTQNQVPYRLASFLCRLPSASPSMGSDDDALVCD
jgi:hypothetical protein